MTRDDQRCAYCRVEMTRSLGPTQRTRDHIVPVEWGGRSLVDNVRYVCSNCNGLRAAAGHCLGALAAAQTVAPRPSAVRWILRSWDLRKINRHCAKGVGFVRSQPRYLFWAVGRRRAPVWTEYVTFRITDSRKLFGFTSEADRRQFLDRNPSAQPVDRSDIMKESG